MHQRRRTTLILIAALPLLGCTMVVPDPNAATAFPGSGKPSTAVSGGQPNTATNEGWLRRDGTVDPQQTAYETPAFPILLRRIPTLEQPDGALILTRGTILDDVAAFAGGKPLLHDPVLDDRGGSLRLDTTPDVLAATRGRPQNVRGILRRTKSGLRLSVHDLSPSPDVAMQSLMLDERPREPKERIATTPGLHRLSLQATGVSRVEFYLDDGSGPLTRIDTDGEPTDGFSATWSAAPDQRLTIRTIGFSIFDEQLTGPSMDVLVGPPLHS